MHKHSYKGDVYTTDKRQNKKTAFGGVKFVHFHKTMVTTTVHFSIDGKMGQTFSPLTLAVLSQTCFEGELSTTEIQIPYEKQSSTS